MFLIIILDCLLYLVDSARSNSQPVMPGRSPPNKIAVDRKVDIEAGYGLGMDR